jgi:hypothetical protein
MRRKKASWTPLEDEIIRFVRERGRVTDGELREHLFRGKKTPATYYQALERLWKAGRLRMTAELVYKKKRRGKGMRRLPSAERVYSCIEQADERIEEILRDLEGSEKGPREFLDTRLRALDTLLHQGHPPTPSVVDFAVGRFADPRFQDHKGRFCFWLEKAAEEGGGGNYPLLEKMRSVTPWLLEQVDSGAMPVPVVSDILLSLKDPRGLEVLLGYLRRETIEVPAQEIRGRPLSDAAAEIEGYLLAFLDLFPEKRGEVKQALREILRKPGWGSAVAYSILAKI